MDLMKDDSVLYKRYDLEQIFLDAMCGYLEPTKELDDYLEPTKELDDYLDNKYQIKTDSIFGIVGIWLGDLYASHSKMIRKGLELMRVKGLEMDRQCVSLPNYQMEILVIYPIGEESLYPQYQRQVQNEVSLFVPERSIFQGERCKGILEFKNIIDLMYRNLDWNLVFGRGVLINSLQIEKMRITRLKYPSDLDGEVEKSVIQSSSLLYEKCFAKLWKYCRQEVHTPQEIKGVCLKYCANIRELAKNNAKQENDLAYVRLLGVIVQARYWREIWEALLEYTTIMFGEMNEDAHYSLLVSQAKLQMMEHYNEGITLEEISGKLHVSEEHLSQLFKKETGLTFSETIRGFRIHKAKELLESSQLKMKEIAQLAGYSDPKYMSKVFKDVVGMSPNDYRKVRLE